ncbi:MAG: hypothetical protein PHD81_01555 [Candidatus Nanoarchaeia archaeon]|nr:hypothetical protein [Candidatus Nanoarchaeia archaeon]MDD5587774.1 hypothetical protein [Candidatus Nanoarchaeia archaeon]
MENKTLRDRIEYELRERKDIQVPQVFEHIFVPGEVVNKKEVYVQTILFPIVLAEELWAPADLNKLLNSLKENIKDLRNAELKEFRWDNFDSQFISGLYLGDLCLVDKIGSYTKTSRIVSEYILKIINEEVSAVLGIKDGMKTGKGIREPNVDELDRSYYGKHSAELFRKILIKPYLNLAHYGSECLKNRGDLYKLECGDILHFNLSFIQLKKLLSEKSLENLCKGVAKFTETEGIHTIYLGRAYSTKTIGCSQKSTERIAEELGDRLSEVKD